MLEESAALGCLELELQGIGSKPAEVHAGNRTVVFCKNSTSAWLLSHSFSTISHYITYVNSQIHSMLSKSLYFIAI